MATISKSSVEGAKQIQSALKQKRKTMAGQVSRGLRKAGLLLQARSQNLVPVDFGILKASAFTRATGRGMFTIVNVGYTAAYAIFVHENVEMKWRGLPRSEPSKGFYWDPQGRGQAKFLETPARAFRPELIRIVAEELRKTK